MCQSGWHSCDRSTNLNVTEFINIQLRWSDRKDTKIPVYVSSCAEYCSENGYCQLLSY
ncbi:MAG TPA: hypothetical protein V6C91_02130 [Coleofasciculaceae cyanobacterium]